MIISGGGITSRERIQPLFLMSIKIKIKEEAKKGRIGTKFYKIIITIHGRNKPVDRMYSNVSLDSISCPL